MGFLEWIAPKKHIGPKGFKYSTQAEADRRWSEYWKRNPEEKKIFDSGGEWHGFPKIYSKPKRKR